MKNRCDPKCVQFSNETHSNKTFVLFFLVYGPNFAMYEYCVFFFHFNSCNNSGQQHDLAAYVMGISSIS